jgi:hypothetical protein
MTEPVTSLDARALVSEIQQQVKALRHLPERPWYVEHARPGHEDEARIYDAGSMGVCKPTTNNPYMRRPLAEFLVAAPRLLTAALGLIEQQQWQPIETAPKDGRQVLLYGCEHKRHWFGSGYYFKGVPGDGEGWIAHSFYTLPVNDSSGCFTPSHWRPLFEPPSLAGARPAATEGDTK